MLKELAEKMWNKLQRSDIPGKHEKSILAEWQSNYKSSSHGQYPISNNRNNNNKSSLFREAHAFLPQVQ